MKRQNAIAAPLAGFEPQHFLFEIAGGVATITLNRPERKNPLTFESYAELRDTFRALRFEDGVHAVVVTGAGGNFSLDEARELLSDHGGVCVHRAVEVARRAVCFVIRIDIALQRDHYVSTKSISHGSAVRLGGIS